MRSTRTASLVTSTLIALLLSGLGQAQEETDSGIRAQPLTKALAEFAEQTGMQLVYPSELTAGVDSNGASTEGTPDEILDELLTSTGLEYEYVNDRTIAIAAPVVIGVDDQGGDSNSGNASLTPILMVQNTSSQTQTTVSSRSDDVTEVQPEDSDVPLEEIIVIGTGTNIRGVENPTVPVLTFDREDIDLSGAATVEEFLRTIPQNFGSETQLTADSANRNSSTRNNVQGSSVDLRGLGAGSTLVLLNGRRMAAAGNGSFVDVSVLPLGVIERIDIMTDGASAIYGSDAVGGVVNFLTRKDFEGVDVNASYGAVTDGSMEDYSVGGAGGTSWGAGGGFLGIDYYEAEPLLASERSYIDDALVLQGGTFGARSEKLSVAGSVNQSINDRLTANLDFLYSDRTASNSRSFGGTAIDSKSDQSALFMNTQVEYEFSSDLSAALFFDYGSNQTETTQSNRPDEELTFDNTLITVEARINGRLFEVLAGPASFAAGALYRQEEFDQGGDGPVRNGERDVVSVYGELLLPVFGGRHTPSWLGELELSVAGRYEEYSDFGDTFDPKIGVHWRLSESFSLRTSYSESFRVADLQTLNQESLYFAGFLPQSSFTAVDAPAQDPRLPSGFALVFAPIAGNPNLSPETAETFSAGFSFEPKWASGLSIEGNFFDVSYSNRIDSLNLLEPIQVAEFDSLISVPPVLEEVEAIFEEIAAGNIELIAAPQIPFELQPSDLQAFIRSGPQNIAERDVSGVDLNVKYTTETTFGTLSAGVNASYLLDFVSRAAPRSSSVDQVDTLYRPVGFKLRANAAWSKDGVTTFLAINYVDDYRDNPDRAIANTIASYTTIDASFAVEPEYFIRQDWADGLRIGFSIQNLFDEEPPFAATSDGFNFDVANADPFGRVMRLSATKRF